MDRNSKTLCGSKNNQVRCREVNLSQSNTHDGNFIKKSKMDRNSNSLCGSKNIQSNRREVNLSQSDAPRGNFIKKNNMDRNSNFLCGSKNIQSNSREVNLSESDTHENTFEKKLENMQTAKIIQKFYSKSQAQAHAQYLRAKAKKENVLVAKIEVVNAYDLYVTNGWFKKRPFKNLGSPTVDSYLVIVYSTANVIAPVEVKKIQKKIKEALKKNTVRTSFFIVKLTPKQVNEIGMAKVNHNGSLTKTIGFKYKHLTQCSEGKDKMRLSLNPIGMHYSIAA